MNAVRFDNTDNINKALQKDHAPCILINTDISTEHNAKTKKHMPGDSTESDDVLEAVYDLALNPNSLDTFTEIWEQFLASHDLSEVSQKELQATLETHFTRAFQLLEKIGRVGKTDSHSL